MDKVIEKAEELHAELDKLPLFQEYNRVKEIYFNSEDIKELEKQIVRAKSENRLEDHIELLDKLHNHPLYLNFHQIEEEVVNYLKEIADLININL